MQVGKLQCCVLSGWRGLNELMTHLWKDITGCAKRDNESLNHKKSIISFSKYFTSIFVSSARCRADSLNMRDCNKIKAVRSFEVQPLSESVVWETFKRFGSVTCEAISGYMIMFFFRPQKIIS